MNVEFITAQEVADILREFGGLIEVLRNGENEFGEPEGENTVTMVTGYFYERRRSVQVSISTNGETSKSVGNTEYRLMVARDEESEKIKLYDEFLYNGNRYKIIDLGKFESAYFEMFCEVIR
ncbi:MAG: hypothetical protein Q4A41_05830 [Bacillota bacterium]|nr:hypothetical protein [Bacillota bacterium]